MVARSYLGTPFHHQAREKGVGIDCIGLLVGVAQEMGWPIDDVTDYSRDPDGKSLIANLRSQLDPVPIGEQVDGDVAVFWMVRPHLPAHVGILTKRGVVHTYAKIGKVVEHGMGSIWSKRLHSVWRYREA
jgi:cell wall-associated NlpC family hydrolase